MIQVISVILIDLLLCYKQLWKLFYSLFFCFIQVFFLSVIFRKISWKIHKLCSSSTKASTVLSRVNPSGLSITAVTKLKKALLTIHANGWSIKKHINIPTNSNQKEQMHLGQDIFQKFSGQYKIILIKKLFALRIVKLWNELCDFVKELHPLGGLAKVPPTQVFYLKYPKIYKNFDFG